MTIDADSTIREAAGKTKQGAAYGHTQQSGYRPLPAGPGAGEVAAARLRNGASKKDNAGFIVEAVGRARRAGAEGR